MSRIYDAAIVGGGFSGLMVAANLALREGPENERPRPAIYWADREGHRMGTAYTTAEGHHLLNVRADKMSAWLGGGADFARWLAPHYPGLYGPESYVPRHIYAQYLASIRIKTAAALGDSLTADHTEITGAVQRGGLWHLTDAAGTAVTCRHLVLATGNPPVADPGWPAGPRFVADVWRWRLAGGRAPDAPHIVIAGTGLTKVDTVMSMRADGYAGPITAVSPHGRWPEAHRESAPYEQGRVMVAAMMRDRTARGCLHIFRAHVDWAAGDWRAVVNAMREHTAMVWQALPPAEKARAMRHLWSRWNIHRHRMAPEIRATLDADAALATARGTVHVDAGGAVTIRARDGAARVIDGAAAVNCTGPDYRRMVAGNPLLAALAAGGYLAAGPLGLGVATPAVPGLHAVGTLLLGERLETTAVPDLRQQAAAAATRIAAAL